MFASINAGHWCWLSLLVVDRDHTYLSTLINNMGNHWHWLSILVINDDQQKVLTWMKIKKIICVILPKRGLWECSALKWNIKCNIMRIVREVAWQIYVQNEHCQIMKQIINQTIYLQHKYSAWRQLFIDDQENSR